MIPGSKPKIQPTAKVRIGEKRQSSRGTDYPAAVDYFLCDDAEFTAVAGEKPKTLRIRFVHPDVDDAFSTGLEWWVKKRSAERPTLACYTKDGGANPTALRLDQMLDAGQTAIGPPRGTNRLPIACAARACPHFIKKDCKPMGRLVFVLDGGTHVYQIDTKAWNSIELLEGALRLARARGPLDGDRVFELHVEMVKKGRDQFPVMSIKEADVLLDTDKKIDDADAYLVAMRRVAASDEARTVLAELLDVTNPGWREREDFVARIRELGASVALKSMLDRWQASA